MKSKLFTLLLLGIFMISFASAIEWDNVKEYDSVTREVTIYNTFLGIKLNQVGKARLNTPLNVKVAPGYQKVAEFDIWAYEDYNDALKQFEFEDLNNGRNKINRDYDLKYLSYEDVLVYDNVCTEMWNEQNDSIYTDCYLDEGHIEQKQVWTKITPANLKKNEVLTIGVFTDVQVGDHIDWIPTIYGKKVPEWAAWEASLNTGITSFFYLDELAGTNATDELENYHGIISGVTLGATGVNDYAYNFDDTTDSVLFENSIKITSGDRMYSFWIKTTSTGTDSKFYADSDGADWGRLIQYENGQIVYNQYNGAYLCGGNKALITDGKINDGNWHHIVTGLGGGNCLIYVDGVLNQSTAEGSDTSRGGTSNNGGFGAVWGSSSLTAEFDMWGIWDREITASEVTNLYNEGTPVKINATGDNSPNITLTSPISANYTASQSLSINFTAFDDINLSDVKLYVNNLLNQTNATGVNNSVYSFPLNLGDGNYTIYGTATDNNSKATNSSSIVIFIDSIKPQLSTNINTSTIYTVGEPILLDTNITDINLNTVWYNYNGINTTITNALNATLNQTVITTVAGQTIITIYTNDTLGNVNSTTESFVFDSAAPTINITSPIGNIGTFDNNITFNWTATDTNLDQCWYNFNGTNTTVTCGDNTTTFVPTNQRNITFYANDTMGNLATDIQTFDWNIQINIKDYSGTIIPTSLLEIPSLGISSTENPYTRSSQTILGTSESVSYTTNVNDTTNYNKYYSATVNYNTTQSIYNISLEQKTLTLNFYHVNGSTATVDGFVGNSSTNIETFTNTTLVSILKDYFQGKISVNWLFNGSVQNYTQWYEFDNDWVTNTEQNVTVLDTGDVQFYVRVMSDTNRPIENALVVVDTAQYTSPSNFSFIGQRFTDADGYALFYVDDATMQILRTTANGYTSNTQYPPKTDFSLYDHSTKELAYPIVLEKGDFLVADWASMSILQKYDPNDTVEINFSIYAPSRDTVKYITSYKLANTGGNQTIQLDKFSQGKGSLSVADGDWLGNTTDDITLYVYLDNVLWKTIIIQNNDLDKSKFNEFDGLNTEVKNFLLWIMLILLTALLGLMIKGTGEEEGAGDFGKMIFMIGCLIVAFLNYSQFYWIAGAVGLWFALLIAKKWIES